VPIDVLATVGKRRERSNHIEPVTAFARAALIDARAGELARVFVNMLDPREIGIAWIPSRFLPRPLRPTEIEGGVPLSLADKPCVVPNVADVLETLAGDGAGLVRDIEIK
jgi:hypothetical protein